MVIEMESEAHELKSSSDESSRTVLGFFENRS